MILWFAVTAMLASSPDLGIEAGRCRAPEAGPAFMVQVEGLKDRAGRLKLELYPANERDFLADDNVLVAAGKAFARVDVPTPANGSPTSRALRLQRHGPRAHAVTSHVSRLTSHVSEQTHK